jgi:hypothetical protein
VIHVTRGFESLPSPSPLHKSIQKSTAKYVADQSGDKEYQSRNGIVRIARVDGEKCKLLENPEIVLDKIRKCGRRVDLFTFMPKGVGYQPKVFKARKGEAGYEKGRDPP